MQPVLTVSEMHAVDARAQASTPLEVLVGRAGLAVAVAALDMLGGAYGRRVVAVCGRGNNGADGRVAAQVLRAGVPGPAVVEAGTEPGIGPGRPGHRRRLRHRVPRRVPVPEVDPGTPVLAVDIPSGVEGDTGQASGAPLAATRTVTFAALKPGLVQGDGVRSGRRGVGWPTSASPPGPPPSRRDGGRRRGRLLPTAEPGGNKWSAAVLVVAGSPGMTGAAGLCARSAYRAGAGMVRLGVPGGRLAEAPATEAVSVTLPADGWSGRALEAAERCAAVVVGPGLGRRPATAAEVRRLVAESPVPVVVDADGLFALGPVDGTAPVARVDGGADPP